MSTRFDLDAVISDEPEPFRFTWGGQSFELPALLAMPIEQQLRAIDAIDSLNGEAGKDAGAIAAVMTTILGQDLLGRLNAAKPLPAVAVMRLLSAWMEHQGVAPGKSQDSSESSASTATPSKATSRSGRARKTS